MSRGSCLLAVAALLAATACRRSTEAGIVRTSAVDSTRVADTRRDSIVRARPGYVIDSVLPIEEEIRRFRVGLTVAPRHFRGGAGTRAELLSRFAAALERRDTVILRQLTIDRAEYAYLVYPGSENTRPPYRQPPAIAWMLLSAGNEKAFHRLVDRYGGKPLDVAGVRCDGVRRRDAGVTYWPDCRIPTSDESGRTVWRRLFGSIVERDGRVKFLSYANGL